MGGTIYFTIQVECSSQSRRERIIQSREFEELSVSIKFMATLYAVEHFPHTQIWGAEYL